MTEINNENSNTFKAVFATLTGFFFLASVSLLVKLEIAAGASTEWVIFIQYLTCLVIITFLASKNKFRDLKTTKLKYHFIRGISGILAFTFFVTAVSEIPLVNANLLNNTAPLFIPILTMIWLKNRIDNKIWWGILIGFTGIIFILDPTDGNFFEKGDMYGLCAGISLAVTFVTLGILTKTESFITILFYYSLIAFVLTLPFAIANWSNPPLLIWLYAILTGALFISYLYLLQFAYRYVPVVKLSPLNFSVVIFAGILDYLIYDHIPGISSFIGIILVIIGGVISIKIHHQNNPETKHHWHF
ncbi:MAG TPA: DMT family transporter [Ignavibacteria bacterium]|nr:DMT family transporter [Ignavibacteria bacterium]